jgi:hypothetical protein
VNWPADLADQAVRANCAAIGVLGRLGPADVADLRRIGLTEGSGTPAT